MPMQSTRRGMLAGAASATITVPGGSDTHAVTPAVTPAITPAITGVRTVLPNGRMGHDMYPMQVKSPEESTGEWDIFKRLQTIPGEQAFRSLAASGCRLA